MADPKEQQRPQGSIFPADLSDIGDWLANLVSPISDPGANRRRIEELLSHLDLADFETGEIGPQDTGGPAHPRAHTDRLHALNFAGLLLDPESEKPLMPLTSDFLQERGQIKALDLILTPLEKLAIPSRIAAEGAISGFQSIFSTVPPGGTATGSSLHELEMARAEARETTGQRSSLMEDVRLSEELLPLPIGMRPAIQAVVDPLNLPIGGVAAGGGRKLISEIAKLSGRQAAKDAIIAVGPARVSLGKNIRPTAKDLARQITPGGNSVPIGTRGVRIGEIPHFESKTSEFLIDAPKGDTLVLTVLDEDKSLGVAIEAVGKRTEFGIVEEVFPGQTRAFDPSVASFSFNQREVRDIAGILAEKFPNAKTVSGFRVTKGRNVHRTQELNLDIFRRETEKILKSRAALAVQLTKGLVGEIAAPDSPVISKRSSEVVGPPDLRLMANQKIVSPPKIDPPKFEFISPEDAIMGRTTRIDPDPVMDARVGRPVNPLESMSVIDLQPIQPGLTLGERTMNLARDAVSPVKEFAVDNVDITPAMNERARVMDLIPNNATAFAEKHATSISDAFRIRSNGTIPELMGIDTALPAAPTIQDVAARLPVFGAYLNTRQIRVLLNLKDELAPYKKMLDEVGADIGDRPDIMDGGFYIPRGNAAKEGSDAAARVRRPGRKGGKTGMEKTAQFDSMAEGIMVGYEYAPIREVLNSHINNAGNRGVNLHVINYMKSIADETGALVGLSPSDLVDPKLRGLVNSLRNRIAGRRKTLIARVARGGEIRRTAARAGRAAEHAGDRAVRGAFRAAKASVEYSVDDLRLARSESRRAIADAKYIAVQIAKNAQNLKDAGMKLTNIESKAEQAATNLLIAIRQAEAQTDLLKVGELHRPDDIRKAIDKFNNQADRFAQQTDRLHMSYDTMAARVEDLMGRGEMLKDMAKEVRDDQLLWQKVERGMVQKRITLAGAQREFRMLNMELNRLTKFAGRQGARSARAQQLIEETENAIKQFSKELEDVAVDWQKMVARSRQVPQGYDRIRLAGLEQHSFPQELADAANKVLLNEGMIVGKGSFPIRVVNATQNLFRTLNATGDNSALFIQGLLGMYGDPRAYARALEVNLKAWGIGGDKVLGRHLEQFDRMARSNARLTSQQWTRLGIHMAGGTNVGEFQLTAKLAALPVLKQANRAFGFFGDALRLQWADDMLRDELAKPGQSIQSLLDSGDIKRIVKAANSMTGQGSKRFGGDFGEMLTFAPKFLQSRLETVARGAMGLRPGATLDQKVARQSLLKMIGFGTALTFGANHVLGNETDTRLFVDGKPNPNFMRIRWQERDWSIFGTWDSLLKLLALTATGRPVDAIRQMPSALTRFTGDFITGSNVIGERTRDTAEQVFFTVFKAMLPFASSETPEIAEHIREGKIGPAATTIVGEAVGAKSSSFGFTDTRDIVAQEKGARSFDSADANVQRDIMADSRVQEQLAKIQKRKKPVDINERVSRAFDDKDFALSELEAKFKEQLNYGLTGQDRRRAIQDFKQARYNITQALLGLPDIQEFLNKDRNMPVRDMLGQRFWAADAPLIPGTNDLDFDARDESRKEILDLAEKIGIPLSYIRGTGPNAYRAERFVDPDISTAIREYEEDIEYIADSGFWDIRDEKVELWGATDLYSRYLSMTPPQQQGMRVAHPEIQSIETAIKIGEWFLRQGDRDLEAALLRWEFRTATVDPERAIEQDIERQRTILEEVIPMLDFGERIGGQATSP